MKAIRTIEFMIRKNLGNYEHAEIKLSAVVEEGQDVDMILNTLKKTAHFALLDPHYFEETPATLPPKVELAEAPKKAGKEKKSTPSVVAAVPTIAEVVPESTSPTTSKGQSEPAKAAVKYSNAVLEHKSAFAAYLAKNFGDSWKKKEGLKDFSISLNGQDFLDAKGQIVPSFQEAIKTFFGSETGVL